VTRPTSGALLTPNREHVSATIDLSPVLGFLWNDCRNYTHILKLGAPLHPHRIQPFSQKPRSPVRPTATYQSYMNHILERIRDIFWTGIDRPSPGSWKLPILTVVERSRDEHGRERLSFKSITRRTRARFVLRRHFVQKPADVAGHKGHIAHNAASVQKSAKDCRAQWQYSRSTKNPSVGRDQQ